jgi:methylmalonyl-CoA mutase N-terminal domain/subunit
MMESCLAAVKAYATHGEICYAMRDVFGEYGSDSQLGGI